jgi:hypothetical protein
VKHAGRPRADVYPTNPIILVVKGKTTFSVIDGFIRVLGSLLISLQVPEGRKEMCLPRDQTTTEKDEILQNVGELLSRSLQYS